MSTNEDDPSSSNSPINLLIFEDDIDDFYIVQSYLRRDESNRYTIFNSSNLEAGFTILDEHHVDVILLDLNLDDSAGLDTLETLLTHDNSVPVIVLTGLNEESLGKSAIKMGASDYLPKSAASSTFLSRSIGYAIERQSLIDELKRQADQDPLTKLPNRAALYKRLDSLVEQGRRRYLPIALMMIDLDGFKQVNDIHGHRAGDELLKVVASRLGANLRKSDMLARLGGDEFILLITNHHNSKELEKIANDKLTAVHEPITLNVDGKAIDISISVSIGVVEWKDKIDVEKLISIADKNMYESKSNGKAQITFHSEEQD